MGCSTDGSLGTFRIAPQELESIFEHPLKFSVDEVKNILISVKTLKIVNVNTQITFPSLS